MRFSRNLLASSKELKRNIQEVEEELNETRKHAEDLEAKKSRLRLERLQK